MTDRTETPADDMNDVNDSPEMDDLELVTSYLNGHLDPEQAEAVRRRLEEDPAFLEFASPVLLTWSIPTHLERHPRPEGELERDWAEFVRRSGFPQRPRDESDSQRAAPPPPPRKPRRRWPRWLAAIILLPLFVLFGLPALANLVIDVPVPPEPQYSVVPFAPGWITLNDGIDVQLEPSATLQVAHRKVNGMRPMRLDGTARFRVAPIHEPQTMLRPQAIVVETRAGNVIAGESDFSVTTRADTTLVYVLPLGPREALGSNTSMVTASIRLDRTTHHLAIRYREGARLVTGHDPERILPRP